MNNETKTGGPAFPRTASKIEYANGEVEVTYQQDGMTLRDYFAAKVMQGCFANDYYVRAMGQGADEQGLISSKGRKMTIHQIIAETAYLAADAMLKERDKK